MRNIYHKYKWEVKDLPFRAGWLRCRLTASARCPGQHIGALLLLRSHTAAQ